MTELPNRPWEHLWADLYKLLPSKEYVLVVECLYSWFPAIAIVTSISASAIIWAMDKVNRPSFNSQDFANFTKHMGFKHTKVTPYAPWANHTGEHFMRNLEKVLKTSHIDDHNWKTALQCFLGSYRAMPHCTMRYPPAQLLFNYSKYKTQLPNATINTDLFQHSEVQENNQCQKLKQNEEELCATPQPQRNR